MIEDRPSRFNFQFSLFFRDYFAEDFVFINFEVPQEALFHTEHNRYELTFSNIDPDGRAAITNGSLGNDIFYVEKIIFHWTPLEGSSTEHNLRWTKYDGELQIMTFNSRYGSFENALSHGDDGLAAFAIFLQERTLTFGDSKFMDFFLVLTDLINSYNPPLIVERTVPNIFLPERIEQYIMYRGSLTTEPCTEIVKWMLFKTPIRVSPFLLSLIRNTFPESPENVRKIQPLNHRKFYFRFEDFDSDLYDPIAEEVLYRIPSLFDNLTRDFISLVGENPIPFCFKEKHCSYSARKWDEVYPKCGRRLQSPINIDLSVVTQEVMPNFYPVYDKVRSGKTSLPVPRHDKSIYVHFPAGEERWELVNQLNNEKYVLNRIKIVLGFDNGSEHSINGKFHPIELQFINVNELYGNIVDAEEKVNGILIISKFFEFSSVEGSLGVDHAEFQKLIPSLGESIRYFNGLRLHKRHFTKEIFIEEKLEINNLLGPPSEIFIYNGSLSEPPCSQNVTWFIRNKVGLITPTDYKKILEQSREFQLLVGDITGLNEKRPIQPTGGREILVITGDTFDNQSRDWRMIINTERMPSFKFPDIEGDYEYFVGYAFCATPNLYIMYLSCFSILLIL